MTKLHAFTKASTDVIACKIPYLRSKLVMLYYCFTYN